MTGPTEAAPFLRVVRGAPSSDDLAALVCVLRSRHAQGAQGAQAGQAGQGADGGQGAQDPAASQWADRSLFLRRPLPHGPGGWRASARRR